MDRTIKNLLLGLIITIGISVTVKSESELEPYKVVSGISGSISSIGSDTLANLVTLWAEEFKRAYPAVNVQIQAAGSSTAPPALTEGTSSLGPMSRKMKDKELESFEARYGYKPTAVPVAIDALAVFVHKDNPITSLSMQEVDSIFSSTLRCVAMRSFPPGGNWVSLELGWEEISSYLVEIQYQEPMGILRNKLCVKEISRIK